MASGSGKLKIIDSDSKADTGSTLGSQQEWQQQQQQQQQQAVISDDEEGTTSKEKEIVISGIEAVKICHFCKDGLKNLGQYYHARVTREPPEGSVKTVTIKGGEKYAADIKVQVDQMIAGLKKLSEEVVKLDVTKADAVRQLAKQYSEDSGVLIYMSPMDFKVYVVADGYEKRTKALHQVKVALGIIATSTRTGREMEASTTPRGKNKLYPDLHSDSRTEENKDPDDTADTNYTRSGLDLDGTDVDKGYRKPKSGNDNYHRSEREGYSRNNRAGQYGGSDDEGFDFSFRFDTKFTLKVYKASITKLEVQAIVNAANDNLVHGGGVAAVISKAAGYQLDRESRDYVNKNGFLQVGENCLTTAGNLRYKNVIHAVGPQWHDYSDKVECLKDLYKTILNILITSERENFRTVAMSAISAGIYAVPKELCADMYVLAVVDYNNWGKRFPWELHIVDIDVSILRLVEESFKKWKKDPNSIRPAEALKKYLEDHPYAAAVTRHGKERGRRYNRQFSEPSSETSNLSAQFEGLSVKNEMTIPLKWGGDNVIFSLNDSLKVHVYTGKIDRVTNVDAVVCSTDTQFGTSGYILQAFFKAFGEKYKKNFDIMQRKERTAKLAYVYTCKTGSMTAPYVMHLAMKSLVYGSNDEIKEYKKGMSNILKIAERKQFEKIALPLLGTGYVQNKPDVLKSCGGCILEALKDFCCHGNSKYLLEVHLVNNNQAITEMLRDYFEEAAKVSDNDRSRKPGLHPHRTTGSHGNEASIGSGNNFSKSLTETRTYSSSSSSTREHGFDNFARSIDERRGMVDSGRSEVAGFGATIKHDDSGRADESETVNNVKKKGNLKIFTE